MAEPRTVVLHVRLSESERERLSDAAEAEYLPESTWARRAILRALAQTEGRRKARVAEQPPKPDRGR